MSIKRILQGVAGSLLLFSIVLDGEPAAGAPKTGPVRDVFISEREETVCQPGRREFILDDLRDLHICVIFSGLSGTYTAQLTFLSPDGNVYQEMTLAFVTVDALATVAAVEMEGRRHEVGRAGWRQKGEAVVVATLPVAGTYITQHNLAGAWMVRISVNGRPVDWDYFVLHPRQ